MAPEVRRVVDAKREPDAKRQRDSAQPQETAKPQEKPPRVHPSNPQMSRLSMTTSKPSLSATRHRGEALIRETRSDRRPRSFGKTLSPAQRKREYGAIRARGDRSPR